MHAWNASAADGRSVGVAANARDPAHTDPALIPLAGGPMGRLREVHQPRRRPHRGGLAPLTFRLWNMVGQAV